MPHPPGRSVQAGQRQSTKSGRPLTDDQQRARARLAANQLRLDGQLEDLRDKQVTSAQIRETPIALPPPNQPMAVARILLGDQYADGQDRLMLRAWRGGWWQWRTSYWSEVDQRVVRAAAYHFTESAFYMDGDKPRPWAPNRHKVADLLEALQAVTHTDIDEAPSWIERRLPPANETVSFANGLLHVPTRTLLPHDPNFFNQINVPFEYCDTPPKPERWWQFLDELWSSDVESIEALQQFFGYVLAGATNQHKILLLVGPARSGKGTIARVLTSLIGRAHCCSPTLANLGENFGLEPLIGKSLAVIGDVRLGGRNDHAVVERLLSISGEDMLTIDRKYREAWTGQLGTRFMLISNELPRFGDASGAIASRFVVLTLSRSWLGAEDKELTSKLLGELPGILGWALDGMESLMGLGRFKEPQ